MSIQSFSVWQPLSPGLLLSLPPSKLCKHLIENIFANGKTEQQLEQLPMVFRKKMFHIEIQDKPVRQLMSLHENEKHDIRNANENKLKTHLNKNDKQRFLQLNSSLRVCMNVKCCAP